MVKNDKFAKNTSCGSTSILLPFFASTTSAKMSVIEQLAFFLYYIMCPGINTYYVYKEGTNGRMSLKTIISNINLKT